MTHPNWRALALCELFLGKSKQTLSTLLMTPATDQRSLPPNLAGRTNQWVLGIFTGAWVSGYYQERGNLNRSCITTAVHSSCSDGVTLQLHFHRLYALAALKTVWGLGWITYRFQGGIAAVPQMKGAVVATSQMKIKWPSPCVYERMSGPILRVSRSYSQLLWLKCRRPLSSELSTPLVAKYFEQNRGQQSFMWTEGPEGWKGD